MKNSRSLRTVIVIAFVAMLAQACATLNGEVPFRYTPSLPESASIPVTATMTPAINDLSSKDRKAIKSIADVEEKVTAKLLSDFRDSRTFENVIFPDDGSAAIRMEPHVKRFYWKYSTSPIVFIPFVGLMIYFGAPMANITGTAEISMNLIAVKSGKTIATYQENSTVKSSMTLYDMKTGEMGAELADAFRTVTKTIKGRITADREKIMKALETDSPIPVDSEAKDESPTAN